MKELAKYQGYSAASGSYLIGKLIDRTGTYNTVGVTVTGTGTLFLKEFSINDYVADDTNKEVRKIINIISNTEMVLESAFSADRTAIAAKKALPSFVNFNLLSSGNGTTVAGIPIFNNVRTYFDSYGNGIEPAYLVHSSKVDLIGFTI
jgi:hypothetical protein